MKIFISPTRVVLGLLTTAVLLTAGGTSAFGNDRADKSQYTLFNPTPRDQMREMSTDRPDLTESPYTVDAGHFQIEMDVVNYSHDRRNPDRAPVTVESVSFAAVNLKLGLCDRVDLQVLLEPYSRVRIHDRATGMVERHRGFGDITTRLKVNFWGNDGGKTALGMMPFVKLPSNQDGLGNNAMEGGIIFPFAAELPAGWGMGAMTEVDFLEDGDGRGHHAEFVNTITFGHDIVGDLAGYVEFFSAVSTERGSPWVGSVNFGFTYGLTDDIQLDTGLNIGVTRSADDLNPFLGISWRY